MSTPVEVSESYSDYINRGILESSEMGSGYDVEYIYTVPSAHVPALVTACWLEPTYIYPTEAVLGTASTADTKLVTDYEKNKSWNTRARSIESIEKGSMFSFTCPANNEGLCIGLGPLHYDVLAISQFAHALLIDISGIYIYENGVTTKLTSVRTDSTVISIYFLDDNRIVYTITEGTDVTLETSQTPSLDTQVHTYGYLYSSDSLVSSATSAEATVHYESI